ncbi:VOC family protein [Jatrophihabitans telluris]|uniref:VOC family protein n=1 Tax=Jatrophihabitans telluris TaxID=2038343 RepID=A0ABY4R1S1_9ACTN|nr:VOC family protein [Jatrophihabitans telluris]UQX89794.1 VOC family protein [Jatrophihabitans telluris]
MVTRDTAWPAGTPCWVDVAANDIGTAKLFYEEIFGWDIPPGREEFGGYTNASIEGRLVAGLTPKMDPAQPTTWTMYFAVTDADAAAASITANGGTLLAEPMDVMDLGRMAIAVDPLGAVFGIWQAGTHSGIQRANEDGALVWEEHMSPDFEKAKAFYSAVFGFGFTDMSGPDFTYASFNRDGSAEMGDALGGIGQTDGQSPVPVGWAVYFQVPDVDSTVDDIVKRSGSVLLPPSDTPYGRMSLVSDPEGAAFYVMSPPAQASE